MRHPDHDAIAAEVRTWYQHAFPDTGYTAEPTWFGVFRGNTGFPFNSATVTSLAPADVGRFVREMRDHYGDVDITARVVGEALDDGLDLALRSAGFERGVTTAYLVHVGDLPDVDDPPGYMFDRVDAEGFAEFSVTKLKGFASSEEEPTAEAVQHEIDVRTTEHDPINGVAIGRIDGEPAGITAWYGGGDAMIFLVATRVPFRGRGVASAGIRRVLEHELATGARSVLINGDVDDHPIEIYRRLGFTDEVYREHSYRLPGSP